MGQKILTAFAFISNSQEKERKGKSPKDLYGSTFASYGNTLTEFIKLEKNSIFLKNGKMVFWRNSAGGKPIIFLDIG